jgi:RNA polymerase sigma-70 factor (ECF subfamily)
VAWDGLTGEEAAKMLGCTRSAFSVRLARARKRLASHLLETPATTQNSTGKEG